MRILSSLGLALCLATPVLADTAMDSGRVILTVTGELPEGNVPPNTLDDVGYFTYHELEFDTGFGFDQAALDALEQHTATKPYPGTETMVEYSGPLLSDVMEAAGASGKLAMPLAMGRFQRHDRMGRDRG